MIGSDSRGIGAVFANGKTQILTYAKKVAGPRDD